MPHIHTQQIMRRMREEMRFCYLCGKPLQRQNQKPREEHVVPRSLLKGATCKSPWPITLHVHEECDDEHKGPTDELLKLLNDMHTKPVENWPDNVVSMPLKAEQLIMDDGELQHVFTGAAPIIGGVFDWVRGMHAALYDEFLPKDTEHGSLPPVPATSGNSAEYLAFLNEMARLILAGVWAACDCNACDSVVAWCDELRYACTWQDTRLDREPRGFWTCLWRLDYPGVLTWEVPEGSIARPWCGYYCIDHCPQGASILTQGAMDRFNSKLTSVLAPSGTSTQH